jgi:putative photosynthetic complex assembly protein 2
VRDALRSIVLVVFFWWSATGVIFALERTPATRLLGLLLATVLAGWGTWLLYRERDHESAAGARRTFLGAAFLWTWVQVAFYGGWLVGPTSLMVPVPAEVPSWSLAVRAVLSMFWYQLAMLAVLAITAVLTARRVNRAGWWALVLFWVTHQAASINIFLGVENPGRGFFPEPLTYLESFFGPQRNSWLLPITIALLLLFTLRTIVQALRDASPLRRQGMMLLAVLGVLGVLELAVLGMPVTLPFWQTFLEVRGY